MTRLRRHAAPDIRLRKFSYVGSKGRGPRFEAQTDQGEKRLMFFRSRMMFVAATGRPDGASGPRPGAVKIGLILP